jgi:hypothetical protein
VLNVIAGTGNYEPVDPNVVAVEPSVEMIAKGRPDSALAVRGRGRGKLRALIMLTWLVELQLAPQIPARGLLLFREGRSRGVLRSLFVAGGHTWVTESPW